MLLSKHYKLGVKHRESNNIAYFQLERFSNIGHKQPTLRAQNVQKLHKSEFIYGSKFKTIHNKAGHRSFISFQFQIHMNIITI